MSAFEVDVDNLSLGQTSWPPKVARIKWGGGYWNGTVKNLQKIYLATWKINIIQIIYNNISFMYKDSFVILCLSII